MNEAENPYTDMQIADTLRRHGLSVRFECYAVAMCVDQAVYEDIRRRRGWDSDYARLREVIASISNEIGIRSHSKAIPWVNYAGSGDSSAPGSPCHDSHGNDCGHSG